MTVQLEFQGILPKKIKAQFIDEDTSSDGGLFIFKSITDKLDIINSLSHCLEDERDNRYIDHSLENLLQQKFYQNIAGYNSDIDSDALRKDSMFKLLSQKSKKGEELKKDLASGSTICRLENSVKIKDIHKLSELLVETYIKRNKKRFDKSYKKYKKNRRKNFIITLDLDPTDISTYGEQQLSLFNGYYEQRCYLPLIIADGENGDLVSSILRPGTMHATKLLPCIMERIFNKIENKYPGVQFKIRADSGFQSSKLFDYFENRKNVKYEIALISNKVLLKVIKEDIKELEEYYAEEQRTVQLFGDMEYQAESWSNSRRVVYVIEKDSHKTNIRFIVTNYTIKEINAEKIKLDHNKRSDVENRIKELKSQTAFGVLSCKKFVANFFRVIISSFAYIIFQELKKILYTTRLANSYVDTIRLKIIKVAVRIKITARKIWLYFPKSYPYKDLWEHIACKI